MKVKLDSQSIKSAHIHPFLGKYFSIFTSLYVVMCGFTAAFSSLERLYHTWHLLPLLSFLVTEFSENILFLLCPMSVAEIQNL